MKIVRLPLSDVHKPERNIRIHPAKQLREYGRSITMFGQYRPIVIDENNVILAGVGCYDALQLLEHTEGNFFRIEGLSENQKKKLMIADNKIFGLGIDDLDTFNTFLDELQKDLDIPGYDEELLKSMVASAEEVTKKVNEYGTLSSDDLSGIEAAREKKEATMSTHAHEDNEPSSSEESGPEESDSERVVCPECGAEIWL